MADSYFSTKFGINSLDGFWGNAFYGWRTDRRTDACATALALLTSQVQLKVIEIQNPKFWKTKQNKNFWIYG